MATIRMAVEYDGTDFCGFQYQPTVRTVAGELERALSGLFQETVKISGAGRTDSGVHASGQVVSFRTGRAFPFDRLALALHSVLPPDLSVRDVALVEDGFSARFTARRRRYVYALYHRPERSALIARYAFHIWTAFDAARFVQGARHFVGEHDFRSFCATLPENGGTVRRLEAVTLHAAADGRYRFEISADGFLHRMVRTIVGTLVECAAGRRDPDGIPAMLAARDRAAAGLTAPAHGLYLAGVSYPDYESFSEPPITRGIDVLVPGPTGEFR